VLLSRCALLNPNDANPRLIGVPADAGVLVDAGFDYAWGSVRAQTQDAVFAALSDCDPGPCEEVVFTGHSLGSAITTLAAVRNRCGRPRAQRMTPAHTYPRVAFSPAHT